MKVGIVPTKAGYSAVALPPYDGDWELYVPLPISDDMLVQLRAQILQQMAIYAHRLAGWTGQLHIAIPWAFWSIAALALCSLWTMGLRYTVLYGWIRIFFFGDGLWTLSQILFHLPDLIKARRIRNTAASAKWIIMKELTPLHRQFMDIMGERPYIKLMMEHYPELIPFYDEMLRKEKPFLFTIFPLGITGLIKRLFVGPKIPRPRLIFELGRLMIGELK